MTIQYKGGGVGLTPTAQTIASVDFNAKSATAFHIQITNIDADFRRSLVFWMRVTGRNLVLADGVPVAYGDPLVFPSIALNPGENLQAWAETNGLLHAVASLGVQK